MNNKRIKRIFLLILLPWFITTCNQPEKNTIKETPTAGNIKIAVDEAYQLMIDAEKYTFESLYENAIINPIYKPEVEAFDLFFKDSVRLIVTNRKMTDQEEQFLHAKKIYPKTTKIAYDALVFITNNNNKDSVLLQQQIQDIFSGKSTKWNQINPKSSLNNITVVFDHNKSCNTRYIQEKFNIKNDFPSNCYSVKSNEEVINFVEKNKNAIGIISVNWISDKDDTISHAFLKKIKIMLIGDETNTDGTGNYYKPYQGYIADGTYPFIREVYIINRETFTGLGTGFVNFVAGEKGQRILLKTGLVPATMPIRLVQIKN